MLAEALRKACVEGSAPRGPLPRRAGLTNACLMVSEHEWSSRPNGDTLAWSAGGAWRRSETFEGGGVQGRVGSLTSTWGRPQRQMGRERTWADGGLGVLA